MLLFRCIIQYPLSCMHCIFQLKCHKYWPDETQDYGDISVMLVKSEHYSDYIIRTFNVKRVSSTSVFFFINVLEEKAAHIAPNLCSDLDQLNCVFPRKAKKRREKWNSFISLCGLIMACLNIPLPCWHLGDESEPITRLMLDRLLCTAGLICSYLTMFSCNWFYSTICVSIAVL